MRFLLLIWFFCLGCLNAQTSYVWNGTTSTDWNTSTNWTPNGVPGAIDNVTIVTGSNNCILNASRAITNLTITSGTLNLNTFTLSPSGNIVFTAGTVTSGTLTVSGGGGNTATLTNTTFAASATLNITTGAITINGGTYNGAVTLNQTGATQTTGTGNATFNGTLSITNSGTNHFRMNGNVTYNNTTTFINSGTGYFLPELTTGSTYNGNLTLTNTSAISDIRIAYLGNTNFNGNIIVNNTGGGTNAGIGFGEQATATATLANTKTISVGGSGFTSGVLYFRRFTQVGGTAQALNLTGTAQINIYNNTTFNGNLSVSAPNIYLLQSTFNGTTTLTKTDGTNSNPSTGGNTFASTLTLNYTSSSGTGYWSMANGTADTYNGDVYVNNNSLDRIILSHNSTGNQFNGNVYFTQIGSSVGSTIGWNGGSASDIAASKSVFIGGAGFSVGYLYLQGITQAGNAAVNLTTTGTSSVHIGTGAVTSTSTWGGPVTITSPDIYCRGGIFNSSAVFTKTGGGNDHNNGVQNIFNSTCTINQQSSTGYFMLGYNSNDLFNDDIILTATSAGGINLGWTGGTGTPTLAAGKTISIGGAGFSSGYLRFGGFIQNGNAPINLNLTGSSALYFNKPASNCLFGGACTFTAADFYVQGATFNSAVEFIKTGGGGGNHNAGVQNIFNSTCTITQQSTNTGAYFMLGYNSNDLFNDNIILNATGTEDIYLGYTGGTGTPTLAAGKTILIGTSGYSGGNLYLGTFTQLGNAAINLNMTGTSSISFARNSNIGGNVTVTAPRIFMSNTTFNGTTTFTKTGSQNDNSGGGNVFSGVSSFTKTGTGYILLGNGAPDTWNDDVYFINTNTERILVAYNSSGTNIFNGNIFVSNTMSGTGIAFGNTTGSLSQLAATKNISITGAGFDSGYLILSQFTQLGNAAINLTLTGTTTLFQTTTNCSIGGNLTVVSPRILIDRTTFEGLFDATKTGSTGEWSTGGNTFNGNVVLTNTSAGFFGFANSLADIYNGNLTVNNNGTERIIFINTPVGNQFNGDITLNSTIGAIGIVFGYGTGTATLAATKTIQTGTAYDGGYLQIRNFTQLGSAVINLTLSATAGTLQYGPSAILGGNVVSTSPRLLFSGCTFNGTVDCTKTGATNDQSTGSNIFNASGTFTNSGSGQLMFGNGNSDQFNSASTFNNTGSSDIYVAYNSAGNVFGGVATFNCTPTVTTGGIYVASLQAGNSTFNDNIIVSCVNGAGVVFGNSTGTSTLAATKTISLGGAGFNSGNLILKQFTQVGATPQSLVQTSGTASLYLGSASTFDGDVTFNFPQVYLNGTTYNGTATIQKNGATNNGGNGGNIFNSTTIITNSGSGYLYTGATNRDLFNGVTTFNSIGTDSRIYFAHNHNGQTTIFAQPVTLNANKVGGADGWSYLISEGTNSFVQFNSTLSVNIAGSLQSNFRILQGTGTTALYGGDVNLNLTNTHASTTIQMGVTGNSTYNGNVTIVDAGLGTYQMGNSGISAFNGNLVVSNTAGGGGVYFNTGTTASSNLASTKTISLGAGGFTSGVLSLIRFTQVSATPQTLNQLTGTAAIYLGPTSSFDGDVNFNFPQLYLNGTTYNGTATLQKNGATSNAGSGGNIFNSTTTITNSGSNYLYTGNGTRDLFNGVTTFNCTGTDSRIYFAHNHSGQTTVFAQATTLNSSKTGGTDAWSYLIAESNNTAVQFDGTLTINIGGTLQSNLRILNGTGTTATYNNDVTTNLTNTHSSTVIQFGTVGVSSYNGNLVVTSTGGGSSSGIYFNTTSTATSNLASSKTISLGAGGFTAGVLSLVRFTQLGTTAQTMAQTTGSAALYLGPTSVFNAGVSFNFPQIYLNGTTYNSTATLQKNGITDNDCLGNNIFNGTTSILNTSANRLRLATTTLDTYNGDVTFTQNGAGVLAPNYSTNCTYAGNITVSSTSATTITFGSGTGGIATMSGGAAQTINKSGSALNPVFTRFVMAKSASDVTLNTRINISSTLTMTQGIINTTSTNILNMNDASTTTVGNASSYINGPMNYDMAVNATTRTLNFPIGKSTDWRPAVLTTRHSAATSYTYNSEVFNNPGTLMLGWTKPPTVDTISGVHYWDINRYTTGTTTSVPNANLAYSAGVYPLIQLYFGANDGVYDGGNLTIVKNTFSAPTTLIDIGGVSGVGTSSTPLSGSITSTSNPTAFNSFSRFTLGSKLAGLNPLPVEFINFDVVQVDKTAELNWSTATEQNSSYFNVEHSIDGVNFETIGTVEAAHLSYSVKNYSAVHNRPIDGLNYYRITEYDYNGDFQSTEVKTLLFNSELNFSFYPNPANNLINVITTEDLPYTIELVDVSGQVVYSNKFTSSAKINLDRNLISAGVYTLRYIANEKVVCSKLIVQ